MRKKIPFSPALSLSPPLLLPSCLLTSRSFPLFLLPRFLFSCSCSLCFKQSRCGFPFFFLPRTFSLVVFHFFFLFGRGRRFPFVASLGNENKKDKNTMTSLVASSLEWLLKRALRFVVQRFLGRVLKSEVRGAGKEETNDLVFDGALACFFFHRRRRRPSYFLSFFALFVSPSVVFFRSLGSSRVGRPSCA